jgi:single-strand DNA-binding protein
MNRKGLAMSQDNHITLRGYLTAEPRFHQKTATAVPLAEIRVGSTPRRLNRETGEWQDMPTSYFTVKCWRRLAINASSSLHKGDMVIIRGKFYMNHWVDNQQRPRAALEIEADSLGHDLSYGWTHYLRGTRPQPGSQADVNAGEMARQDLGSSATDAGDDEYAADGDLDELQEDRLGFTGDPLAAASATQAMSITEGDSGDGLDPGDGAADISLPETDAVPF